MRHRHALIADVHSTIASSPERQEFIRVMIMKVSKEGDLHAGCVLNLSLGSLSQELFLRERPKLLLHWSLFRPDLHQNFMALQHITQFYSGRSSEAISLQ